MFFKNSTARIYNLENKKQRKIKQLRKQDNQLNITNLDELINTVAIYHINQFRLLPNQLYNNNADLIDISKESKELLLEVFNINRLYRVLNNNYNYEKHKFENDDEFRRSVMNAVLYQIIEIGGKEKGPEYGLIFSKIFNYKIELPMQYASYNSIYDERFIKYIDTYLELGGSDNIYWLPNYFEDNKNKYNMEPLYEIIDIIKGYISENKVNSIN